VDLGGFDFDQVEEDSSPMLLPGGLKYGGVLGFVPLCAHGKTLICGAPKSAWSRVAEQTDGVTLKRESLPPAELAGFLIR
jgi:hypothetical protein